jgi:sarcosine oxidase
MRRPDVIVVGLGAMGSAVTLRLARRGLGVVGFDQFKPPHTQGSTHGDTRITRLATGEGSDFVPLVLRSHQLWREIEDETAAKLLHQTGGLVLGEPDHVFLQRTRSAAAEYGIAHENLSNAELKERFPMFGVGRRTEAYLEPDAGFVRPEAAVEAQLSLARAAGATLLVDEAIVSWSASSTGASVTTRERTLEADELVLCAGAWITKLVPDMRSLVAIQPQCVHWFPIRRGYEALRAMPVFVWGGDDDQDEFAHGTGFYGIPAIDGPSGGVKLATEVYGATADPDEPWRSRLGDRARSFYAGRVARRFPWVAAGPLRTVPCLYTSTRGSRFIIDRHPAHPNVTIVSACSGHGFKHSPAIGEAVAQTIASGTPAAALASFALAPNALWATRESTR